MSLIISLAAWLVAMLILFLILVGIGHIAHFFSRQQPDARGFDVVLRVRSEGDG